MSLLFNILNHLCISFAFNNEAMALENLKLTFYWETIENDFLNISSVNRFMEKLVSFLFICSLIHPVSIFNTQMSSVFKSLVSS